MKLQDLSLPRYLNVLFEQMCCKMFEHCQITLVSKACTSPRNSTLFAGPFFLLQNPFPSLLVLYFPIHDSVSDSFLEVKLVMIAKL